MTGSAYGGLIGESGRSQTLAKLDAMAIQITGYGLSVIIPQENVVLAIRPAGQPVPMPKFCQIVQATQDGKKICATCRSLMAFGACNLGVNEHSCYGGVSVVVACIQDSRGDLSGSAVVSSCDFTKGNRDAGWKAARTHAMGLSVDLKKLKAAYYQLPHLTGPKQKQLKVVVEVAATALGEFLQQRSTPAAGGNRFPTVVEQQFKADLILARNKSFQKSGKPAGFPLVKTVVSVINRYPAMPFSVKDIARSAHMSPNHFSMLFRRHTGQNFMTFLLEERLELAEKLLRDLSLGIKSVADRAGFDDPGYFTRRFKHKTGLTPREWRERL
jgi:AraC-like DNA-binding protein